MTIFENFFTKIFIICLIVFGGFMAYDEYNFQQNAGYSIAKIDKLWWECNNCDDESYYINYSFQTKNGKDISATNYSLGMTLWTEINDGQTPALVAYYPIKNPTDYRIVGENDFFLLMMILFILVCFIAKLFLENRPSDTGFVKNKRSRIPRYVTKP